MSNREDSGETCCDARYGDEPRFCLEANREPEDHRTDREGDERQYTTERDGHFSILSG